MLYDPGRRRREVLARLDNDPDCAGLSWQPDRGQDGVAWRVVDAHGREEAIYDNPTSAGDVCGLLNTPPLAPAPNPHHAQPQAAPARQE